MTGSLETSSMDDTFNKLRRVPYNDACAIYTLATLYMPISTSREDLNLAAKDDLKAAGWTIEELNAESRRLEKQYLEYLESVQNGAT